MGQIKFCPYFLHFFPGSDEISYRRCPQNSYRVTEFHWNQCSERHTSFMGCTQISTHTFHIYCLIWMTFSIRDLQKMLFSICQFLENLCRRSCTFPIDIIKSHLHLLHKKIWFLKIKNATSHSTPFVILMFLQ